MRDDAQEGGGVFHAGGESSGRDGHRAALHRLRVLQIGGGQAGGLEIGRHGARAALVAREHDARPFVVQHGLQILREQLRAAAPHGELARRDGQLRAHRRIVAAAGKDVQIDAGRLEAAEQIGPVLAELGQAAAEDAVLEVALHVLAPLPQRAAHALPAAGRLAQKDEVVLCIVEERGCFTVQQGDELIQAAEAQPLLEAVRLAEQRFLRLRGRFPAQGAGQLADLRGQTGGVVCQRFHGRGDQELLQWVGAALRLHVERGDGVDLVAPEFQSGGLGIVRREDVQDAAAARELAAAVHLHGALIAASQQRGLRLLHGDLLAGPQCDGAAAQLLRRDGVLQRGVRAGDGHVVGVRRHGREHLQPLALVFVRGALRVAQGKVAVGVEERAQAHGLEIAAQALGFRFVAREHERPALPVSAQRGDEMRLVDGGQAGDGGRQCAAGHGLVELPELRQPGCGVEQEFHRAASLPNHCAGPLRN